MATDWSSDLELALRLADEADARTMARFRDSTLQVSTKPDLTPVTEADRDTELALREALSTARPADAVRGEELADTGGAADRVWVLDPIDGTKNYMRGVPVWATLIALVADGNPVVGVVSAPALGRRWWAAGGGGAYTRDVDGSVRAVSVSAVSTLADASFSFSDHRGWDSVGVTGRDCRPGLDTLLERCWRVRAYGDFLSHMLVAEGAVDIAAEPELSPWDIAALVPVIVEAGGRCTGYDGSPAFGSGSGLTSNGILHDAVLELLA